MQLLFVHDFPAEKYKSNYYSIGFSYKIWERYLNVFETMLINSRVKEVSQNKNKNKNKNQSNGIGVTFETINEYKTQKSLIRNHKEIINKLTISIKKSEGVLIRLPSVLGFIAANICMKLNKPYMVEVVGAAFDAYWYHGSIFGKFLSLPMEMLQKQAVKNASTAIYVTKNYLSNKYQCKGKEFTGVSNIQKISSSCKNLEVNKNIKIGLIGSAFVDYKGHDVAIKAVSKLIKQGFDISLEFVGDGPNKKFLNMARKLQISNNVVFKGKIYNKKLLNEWFSSLDIYIQPSLTEGHCRAIVEAIGNGVPTLASSAGGNEDSVDEKYLFKAKDYKALASLLEKSINSKKYRYNNVKDNFAHIKEYEVHLIQRKREEALQYYKNILLK